MTCEHAQKFMDAYVDGELDVENTLMIESHLNACPACNNFHKARRQVCAAVQSQARYFSLPELAARRLRARIERPGANASLLRIPPRWVGYAATAVFAAMLGSGATLWVDRIPAADALAREVVANHSRSLMVAGRITDISSSDQHTVKPWFNGKVDFSPPVLDLTAQGFPLVGGRLDYLDNRPVAALIYRHRQHLINLFVLPLENSATERMRTISRHGYHLLHWSANGMSYWAVSDLNPVDLEAFGALVKNAG